MFCDPRSVPAKTGVAMPAAIKRAETAMRIGDPNLARLTGERLAEVPVKLQESTLPMMSLRQYSYVRAEAGVAMATKVNALSAATEVAINSKRLSMSFFLAWVLERITSSRAMR